ncbi:MAG: hypothetical protein V4469_00810 [Patescibacteria group bacterium]
MEQNIFFQGGDPNKEFIAIRNEKPQVAGTEVLSESSDRISELERIQSQVFNQLLMNTDPVELRGCVRDADLKGALQRSGKTIGRILPAGDNTSLLEVAEPNGARKSIYAMTYAEFCSNVENELKRLKK